MRLNRCISRLWRSLILRLLGYSYSKDNRVWVNYGTQTIVTQDFIDDNWKRWRSGHYLPMIFYDYEYCYDRFVNRDVIETIIARVIEEQLV